MSSQTAKQLFSDLLRQWYWSLAVLLTLIIWAALSACLWPMKDRDGTYASHPYGLSTGMENNALDLLFQLRDVRHPDLRSKGLNEPITLILIDETSIRASGVRMQKWPREWYAQLVDRASKGGAAVIGLDLLLSEEGGRYEEEKAADQKLIESMAQAGNVVLAAKLPAGGYSAIFPLPMFSDAAYAVGFADLPLDPDGFVRSVPLTVSRPGQDTNLSFSTRLAEGYLASKAAEGETPPFLQPVSEHMNTLGNRNIPLRLDRYLQIDYRARTPAFKRISAGEILFDDRGQSWDDLFKDRIVIIGAANIDAPDLFETPFYETLTLPRWLDSSLSTDPIRTSGAEINANAVATLLFGQSPVRPRYIWQIAFLLVPLALVALVLFRLPTFFAILAVLIVALGVLVTSSWAFNAHGIIFPLASTLGGIAVLTPLGFGLRVAHQRLLTNAAKAERALVMDILSRCVSTQVAEELWHRREKILSGERHVVTIIFTDIRAFTTIAETAASEQIVEWLNLYFSRMNVIVEKHCGHIDKFIGDGLMIVFGAPASRGEVAEARAAVACGLDMLAEVENLNTEWAGTGRPQIKIGVGIHTGDATCGVVGAERRLEYTVIGDTVNLAARLETTTKDYGVPILISEATAALVGEEYVVHALGEVRVKGKNINSRIFTVSRNRPQEVATPAAVA